MRKEPVFFIDKDQNIILETIFGTADQAILDSLKYLEILEPNTNDGAVEKHVPVIETDGSLVSVKVGSVPHPMTEEHSITWILLQTREGSVMRVNLTPDSKPIARFTLNEGDSPKAAFAYCNLHGLWKTEI